MITDNIHRAYSIWKTKTNETGMQKKSLKRAIVMIKRRFQEKGFSHWKAIYLEEKIMRVSNKSAQKHQVSEVKVMKKSLEIKELSSVEVSLKERLEAELKQIQMYQNRHAKMI